MLLDAQNLFSSAQAVTATAASTNYIDLSAHRRIGTGEPVNIVMACVVAMTDASSDSTITVTLESDDNTSFSSPTVVQTLATFAAVSAAGTTHFATIYPNVIPATEKYIQLRYTAANGNLTTGSFTSGIILTPAANFAYPDSITIS